MRDKDITSIKSSSQGSHPYPLPPCLPLGTPYFGPHFFSQDLLPEDDDMEPLNDEDQLTSPNMTLTQLTPNIASPDTPETPTPIAKVIQRRVSPPHNLLLSQKMPLSPTTTMQSNVDTSSDLAQSIHVPRSNMEDQTMDTQPAPPRPYSPNKEERTILAHLTLVEKNRSTIHHDGPHHCTTLPKFTPTPIGSFPVMHMTHSAEPIHISPPQPQGGRESKAFPIGFLVHNISEEIKDLVLSKCIWSASDITFQVFMTSNPQIVHKAVTDIWAADECRAEINDIISMSEIKDEEDVYTATWSLIKSTWVKHLDFKVTGGVSVPRFDVFTISSIYNAKAWTDLCSHLHVLDYPTGLDGCGSAVAMTTCPICHSIAHPCGLCPFPNVPSWNGPKIGSKTTVTTARNTKLHGKK
ncbi:hypothetical protein C8R48DRAFT_768830 [Suillus tomentosus]|nr:hypothetical protein C8R48DRAFT_768830 [Suillus tomentosus]